MFTFLKRISLKNFIYGAHVAGLLIITTVPAWGSPYFIIKKSDDLPPSLTPVRLRKDTSPLSAQWVKNIEKFFPQDPKESAPKELYALELDLEGFSSNSLPNVNSFLATLGQRSEINRYVPLLVLENCTSFKFNRIFEGIKEFFNNTPKAQVRYLHKGTQSPAAARRGFALLKRFKDINPSIPPGREKLSAESQSPDEEIVCALARLKIAADPHPQRERPPSTFSVMSDEEQQESPDVQTNAPVDMMKEMIQFAEREAAKDLLQKRWGDFGETDWPPLGVLRSSQDILHIHVNQLDEVLLLRKLSPIVLEVAGMSNGELSKLVEFCQKTPSLRCIRIQNSMCSLSNLVESLCERISPDPDESAPARPVLELGIRFLDIQTALAHEKELEQLPDCLLPSFRDIFLSHTVWLSQGCPQDRLKHFSEEVIKRHQLWWLFTDYLNLLEESSSLGSAEDAPVQ